MINGDEEWLINYGHIDEDITWEVEEIDNATTDNSPMVGYCIGSPFQYFEKLPP